MDDKCGVGVGGGVRKKSVNGQRGGLRSHPTVR